MRVVDFRSGHDPGKRKRVLEAARREGADRVYTLVERDEVSTWVKLGFQREGNVPGFFKRSDAFILGTTVSGLDEPSGDESGVYRTNGSSRYDSIKAAGERLHQAARKLLKGVADEKVPQVKVAPAKDADVKRALASAQRGRRALTTFEPFGRDVEHSFYAATARGGFSLMIGVQAQSCFQNALVELLTAPRSEKEAALTRAAVKKLCDQLEANGVVSCFALTPIDNVELAAAFIKHGFRRTGALEQHLLVGGERVDALLWTRKLTEPEDG